VEMTGSRCTQAQAVLVARAVGETTCTRAGAAEVAPPRSSVDHRIEMEGGAISTTGRRSYHPAVQSIERGRPPRGAGARVVV
jgi:hypothetical protein